MSRRKPTMFPHTVTIYNVQHNKNVTSSKDEYTNNITVLHGVLLDEVKAVNVQKSGLQNADSVALYIPFSVTAVDGVSLIEKSYVNPIEWANSVDKSGIWTMTLDGEVDGDSFFVKGEVVEPDLPLERIAAMYDGVYNITKVDAKDFGGDMAHWEVGGA